MSLLEGFFKGSDTKLGVFYPMNYLLAVFDDLPAAVEMERLLQRNGFAKDDVLAVPGLDVVRLADEHIHKDGLSGHVMRHLSRLFGTEELYADQDLEMATEGSAFLAVYCPTETKKREAWNLISPRRPVVARHYMVSGIEHLAGEH